MSTKWTWNPKSIGSGIITCIPQEGKCPLECTDCFFNSGRSYLEPLDVNLPHIPTKEMAKGRVVRVNDGNDSNINRIQVEKAVEGFDDYFFNTSIPSCLEQFPRPFVLTINPGEHTDRDFYKIEWMKNLMYIRIRTNPWNLDTVVKPAVEYYTKQAIPVILTFMAYYITPPMDEHITKYHWETRVLNPYWCLKDWAIRNIEGNFVTNPWVYSCGWKNTHDCSRCGNCIREYYVAKERMRI